MTPDFDFSKIRAEGGDQREGFEEFSAQIFHRHNVPTGSRYERYRGAGGDGGVEAIWRLPTGKVVGLQSKFFLPLKTPHLAQLEKSLDTALDNHPDLETYIVTLPFDPTPTIKAREGEGQTGKLEAWRKSLVARAGKSGVTVTIEWWHESELKSRLLGMDNPEGRILYWFGTPHLSKTSLEVAAAVAEDVAGPRYSPNLRVGSDAGDTLKAFCLDPSWPAAAKGLAERLRAAVGTWTSKATGARLVSSAQILAALTDAAFRFAKVKDLTFAEADRAALHTLGLETLPVAHSLEATLKGEFDRTHGAENDTPVWRQIQAAYQAAFPAADLDYARDACTVLSDLIAFAESSAARAAGASILLMRGPAGIGKTHTTVDATKERVAAGRAAMAILGQEITLGQNLWTVVASKLEISPTIKSEILGVLSAYAEGTGAPFVILVDAINETADRKQWRSWLPQLKADLAGQPIKLLLTCRDIFVDEALGAAGAGLVSFTHAGFAGREYDAAYAFATFYKVGPPAEVVAQPEFANPLFLHLVCRAAFSMKWSRIPGGQVSLTKLITAILDGANIKAAELLDYDVRIENPVRDGALALAKTMGQQGTRFLMLGEAHATLTSVRGSNRASKSLLRTMEEAHLVSVSLESGNHVLRFAFERLGDVLIAQASIADQDKAAVEARFLSADLAALVATPEAVAENAGLIQAYSILLPELFGIEIADLLEKSPANREMTILALGVLVWRDLVSFTNTVWVLRHSRFVDLVEVLNQVLAVAAIPGHPLNAVWLDAQLRSYQQLDRDALWTLTLKQAWERSGPGHHLVRIARAQNLTHMSAESAVLLGTALAWFTASADLLIRDEASHALTRLMVAQPVAASLLDLFIECDDDFVRERVLNSAYGAGLLRNDPANWHEIADITFNSFFAAGTPPANVLLRDLGRLIVEEGMAAGTILNTISSGLVRPPYTSPWPLRLEFPDWAALIAAHPQLPANLKLGESWPDFARYCVETRTEVFDLAAAGLTLAQLNQWIVEQILSLGYTDTSKNALIYDLNLIRQYGQERGVANRHRRVSKKYEWIFLARLLGRLHDNVPYQTSKWRSPPSPTDLQAVVLRTLDPTDLSEDQTAPIPGVKITDFFTVPFSKHDVQDPKEWTAGRSTSHKIQLVGEKWVMLAGYQSCRYEDEATGLLLSNSRRMQAMLVRDSKIAALKKSFDASIPRAYIPDLHQLFEGEFPRGVALLAHPDQWSLDADEFGSPASAIINRFDDPETPAHNLWVPAPELVAFSQATWDGARSWLDASGKPVAAQIGSDDNVGLVFDKALLVEHLKAMKSRLVWIVFENRYASLASDLVGSNDRHQAWSWNGKRLTKIAEEQDPHYPADDENKYIVVDADVDVAGDGNSGSIE